MHQFQEGTEYDDKETRIEGQGVNCIYSLEQGSPTRGVCNWAMEKASKRAPHILTRASSGSAHAHMLHLHEWQACRPLTQMELDVHLSAACTNHHVTPTLPIRKAGNIGELWA